MLFAKISPAAQKIVQTTPFESSTITADHMSALARPYGLGTNKVSFEVIYSRIILDENQNPVRYETVTSSMITLEGAQLQGWGNDDSFILQQLATILGVTIQSYVSVPDGR